MDAEYLLYYFNIPGLTPMTLLEIFLLSLMRIAPIIQLAPFLGGKITPVTTRIVTAVILTLAFLPLIISYSPHQEIGFGIRYILLAFKELFIGTLLGYLISIPFIVAQSSGIIMDYMRGASSMQSQDPTLQSQSSSIGNLFNYILIVLFFQIDGPFIFFDGLIKTYEFIPPNAFIGEKFFHLATPFSQQLLHVMHHIMALSIQLAAPALIAVLMAEVFLGIANRLAPQVQISFLGMSLKSLVGLFILWSAWLVIWKQTSKESLSWLDTLESIYSTFKQTKS